MYHGHAFVILPLFIQLIIFHDELLPFSEGCKSDWPGKIKRENLTFQHLYDTMNLLIEYDKIDNTWYFLST